jgi:hypothetical protein
MERSQDLMRVQFDVGLVEALTHVPLCQATLSIGPYLLLNELLCTLATALANGGSLRVCTKGE